MQNTQDKEFDQFFKDKFEDAEVQPLVNLWGNIERKLGPKKSSILPLYWMAAAIVLLVVAIGLFIPKTEKIRLQASVLAAKAGNNVADGLQSKEIVTVSAETEAVKSTPLIIAPRLKAEVYKESLAAMQPEPSIVRPVDKEPEIIKEPVYAKLKGKSVPVNEVILASANLPVEENTEIIPEQAENKGIRNLGDLVNFVVNKVDKREKKLLQFDTDDDNSSLVSINIGFIKINKKSDK